jgi:hypothetical protein
MPDYASIPNAETRHAIADGRARKGVTVYKSAAEWRKSLIAVSAKEHKAAERELTMKTQAEFSGEV